MSSKWIVIVGLKKGGLYYIEIKRLVKLLIYSNLKRVNGFKRDSF